MNMTSSKLMLNIRVAAGVVSRRKHRFELCGDVHYLSDFGKAVSGTAVFHPTMTSTNPELQELCYTVCSDAEIVSSLCCTSDVCLTELSGTKAVGYSI